MVEKDRVIKQRDALLESSALESRRLLEMLDKERQAHRNIKHQFETFQKTHQHITRTVSSQDARIMELETAKAQDKKRMARLENSLKEQLTERNKLLLTLWTRLSALCGTDWAHDNSLINGRALPSLEAVANMLPGFSKNLLAAVKTIETMVGSFQSKIKSVEKDLWREYQALENHLDNRIKKLDRLEAIVRNGTATGALGGPQNLTEAQARLARLEDAYRQLKVENHTLRAAADARTRAAYAMPAADPDGSLSPESPGGGSPFPSVPTGPKGKDRVVSRIPKTSSRNTLGRAAGPVSPPARTSSHNYYYRHSVATEDGGASSPTDGDDDAMTTPTQPQQQQQQQQPTGSAGQGQAHTQSQGGANANAGASASTSTPSGGMENKWLLRLRDLEFKLKAEREGRLLDRGEALKRISASESENAALRENLERERERRRMGK